MKIINEKPLDACCECGEEPDILITFVYKDDRSRLYLQAFCETCADTTYPEEDIEPELDAGYVRIYED